MADDNDYWPLTFDILHELIYGYSYSGSGRQWREDQLRAQWKQHREAIREFYLGRPTLAAERIARIWRGDSGREWHPPAEWPWAENEFAE